MIYNTTSTMKNISIKYKKLKRVNNKIDKWDYLRYYFNEYLKQEYAPIKIQRWWRKLSFKKKMYFKIKILRIFNDNVKGKKYEKSNKEHNGEEGHWLESQMGVKPNGKNEPDLYGHEMKKDSPKITFVDKTPSKIYLEGEELEYKNINKGNNKGKKLQFWNIFQRTNSATKKIGGWKLDKWDVDGQCLHIDENNNILVLYNYNYDERINKNDLVSDYYKDNTSRIILSWDKIDIETAINNKWNKKGFFICKKNNDGIYNKICFGDTITFNYWIQQVKEQNIYYDNYSSYDGRWRGGFRASKKWFNKHITEEY